jgi:hypothetical protein
VRCALGLAGAARGSQGVDGQRAVSTVSSRLLNAAWMEATLALIYNLCVRTAPANHVRLALGGLHPPAVDPPSQRMQAE